MRALTIVALILTVMAWTGCGGGSMGFSTCKIRGYVSPLSATADHLAVAPGNRVQFKLAYETTGDCAPNFHIDGEWSSNDPLDINIDQNGLATCINATPVLNGAAIPQGIHFTVPPHTYAWSYDSASLTCR